MRRLLLPALAGLSIAAGWAVLAEGRSSVAGWPEKERRVIASLSLAALPPLAPDPSNRVADDPRAAALGKALFSDKGLSANGQVACATCHEAGKGFQDGLPLGRGFGTTARRTMPISGTARLPFLFWDGRKDSQWSQALGPLESPVEHGTDRVAVVRRLAAHYRDDYERLFGPLPPLDGLPSHAAPIADTRLSAAWQQIPAARRTAIDRAFANAGKAIAAFERTIEPRPSRFDRFADAIGKGEQPDGILDEAEMRGLKLFIGKANCATCHNGPLFTDGHFHNTGVPSPAGQAPDPGRAAAVTTVRNDPFNCLGPYSDAAAGQCAELEFMADADADMVRAFKPPSLRDVAGRAPYMHAGQLADLDAVIDHYDRAPLAPEGHSELKPLHLDAREKRDLQRFLATLSPELAEGGQSAGTTP